MLGDIQFSVLLVLSGIELGSCWFSVIVLRSSFLSALAFPSTKAEARLAAHLTPAATGTGVMGGTEAVSGRTGVVVHLGLAPGSDLGDAMPPGHALLDQTVEAEAARAGFVVEGEQSHEHDGVDHRGADISRAARVRPTKALGGRRDQDADSAALVGELARETKITAAATSVSITAVE